MEELARQNAPGGYSRAMIALTCPLTATLCTHAAAVLTVRGSIGQAAALTFVPDLVMVHLRSAAIRTTQ